jgi:predicted anti-sigma-YlaC factor YlaD
MDSEKIREIINRYFDNDLDKNEEVFLFTNLSQKEEAREYFKQMNMLNENIKNTFEEFPASLEEDIFEATISRTTKNGNSFFNLPALFGYAFSILLLIISIMVYSQTMEYKKDLQTNIQQINYQKKVLEMMFNSLPPVEVKGKVNNQIIIKPIS